MLHPLPAWGWAALVFLVLAWGLAWTRFAVFEIIQMFTFTPLWLGYILILNAAVEARGHPSLIRSRPAFLLFLAAGSGVFWWFFEYLNRFTANWYYVGVDQLSPGVYVLYASLPFTTVLPAVVSTHDFLKTFEAIGAGLDDAVMITIPQRFVAPFSWMLLGVSALCLIGIGALPEVFFFALWLAPLGVIVPFQVLSGHTTVFSKVRKGRFRTLYLYTLSALVCGVFWEMWNVGSLAGWKYAIPYVERFRVFEMPILGYAGYLPFGLECLVVADMFETFWAARRS